MSTNSNTNTDQIQNGNRNTNILADVYSNTDTDPTQMLISDKCITFRLIESKTANNSGADDDNVWNDGSTGSSSRGGSSPELG